MTKTKFKQTEIGMTSERIERMKDDIRKCIDKIYSIKGDALLFERNERRGLCERCIVFRFAHYLQEQFSDYFVDCDYNSSITNGEVKSGKSVKESGGRPRKRFIDIIIHKRTSDINSNFICFEIKKWNNKTKESLEKDENNLKTLTKEYGYALGLLIILGKSKEDTTWSIW